MTVSTGLVGLPNAGKSTLFNALTAAGAEVGLYPFTTVGRNVGTLVVPDERLATIAAITRPAAVTPALLEVVDIAGLVRGAHRGEGLGNQFLGHIREVDLILHVVRCFASDRVAHVYGSVDPVRDAETLELELALADLETVERRLERARRRAKAGGAGEEAEVVALAEMVRDWLGSGRAARRLPPEIRASAAFGELFLLTAKPQIYVGNLSDSEFQAAAAGTGPGAWLELKSHAEAAGCPAVPVSAAVEADWVAMSDDEKVLWESELGAAIHGGPALVRTAYQHLDLVTFYTVNENEARARTVPAGTTVAAAAGKIHTDMERGFIRAEVIPFPDLCRAGSLVAARQKGLIRTEGRDYRVADGDIIYVRFAPPT
jgi:GTP-binding protein YchF